MVVEGSIALGDTLELVVEVDDDLPKREVKEDLDAVARDVLLLDQLTSLAEAEGHDGADIRCIGDHRSPDVGLFDVVDRGDVG